MRDLVNPVRVRICTHYAGEAIGTLLKIMQRDDISPATRMKAAKEVLLCIRGVLPVMEAQEFRNTIFQSVHERQSRRALRRENFARRRTEKAARRRNVATADKDGNARRSSHRWPRPRSASISDRVDLQMLRADS